MRPFELEAVVAASTIESLRAQLTRLYRAGSMGRMSKTFLIGTLACEKTAHRGKTADHVFFVVSWSEGADGPWQQGIRWPENDAAQKISSDDRVTINLPATITIGKDQSISIQIQLSNQHGALKRDELIDTVVIDSSDTDGITSALFQGEGAEYTLYYAITSKDVVAAKAYGLYCISTTDEQSGVLKAIQIAFGMAANLAEGVGAVLKSVEDPRAKAAGIAADSAKAVLDAVPEFAELIAGSKDNPDEIYMTYGASEDKNKIKLYPKGTNTKRFINGEDDKIIAGDDVVVPFVDTDSVQIAIHEKDSIKANVIGLATLYQAPRTAEAASDRENEEEVWGFELFVGGANAGGTGNALYGVTYGVGKLETGNAFGPTKD